MPLLSEYARRKKIEYFFDDIPKDARILEVGSGEGWVGQYLKKHGWKNYLGIDIKPPADIVGDLREWRKLRLAPESYDVIVAFEVIEHVDLFQEMYDLLRPGGMLLVTTPVNWQIDYVVVRPDARGRGIAAALVTEAVNQAHRRGVPYLMLTSKAELRPLYERCGFVAVGDQTPPPTPSPKGRGG